MTRYLFFPFQSRLVKHTALSLTITGAAMHSLNIANVSIFPTLSHTWSVIAIVGFILTSMNQLKAGVKTLVGKAKKGQIKPARNDDVSLP